MNKIETIVELVDQAETRIRPYIRQTILEPSPFYSQAGEAAVSFKCENLQHTGSFKARGALNKVLALTEAERRKGFVTASTGNHGAAVAFALAQVGESALVFVPENAIATKVAAIKRLGAEVRFIGNDSIEAESSARGYAERHGMNYVSPYNDPLVIAGQGTIGVELARQMEGIEAVFVSLGGGGLISGIGAYLKSISPQIQIIACSPENSQVMAKSVAAGEILDLPSSPTLSDGTAGGVEPGSITFPLCRDLVDSYISVTEAEIAASLRQFMESHHMLIEGSAAVAIAAYTKNRAAFKGRRVVIVLCGANISLEMLGEVLGKNGKRKTE